MSDYLDSEINIDDFRERFIKYTRKAFQMLPKLIEPQILDVGCGSGVPTIELAKLSDGEITGIDINQPELDKLNRKIEKEGFLGQMKTINCSLLEMDFKDESFDIIWAEGSIRFMGFEKSLNKWNRLLKPNGYVVVHDESNSISNKLGSLRSWGYVLINHFSLPEDVWWTEFYEPLENKINQISEKYKENPKALEKLRKYQNEINMVKRNPKKYASAFYIIQKLCTHERMGDPVK